jgi:hypothetical protein
MKGMRSGGWLKEYVVEGTVEKFLDLDSVTLISTFIKLLW